MTTTATAPLRGNGGVLEVAETVAELIAQAGDGGEVTVTRDERRPVRARGRVHAGRGIFSASVDASGLGCAEVELDRGVRWRDQGSEGE